MKIFTILLFLIISCKTIFPQIAVGYYYANYTAYPHTSIDYSKLTHIAHAFIRPNSNGTISTDSWFFYPELITEAHKNGVKVIVAAGGFGNSDGFKPMCANAQSRAAFVKNLVEFCQKYGYDGADMDWEYPKSDDKANFVSLMTELRTAFNAAGLTSLSAALPSVDWGNAYDIPALKNLLDWFGIMTYDYYGPWENNSGHNSPLYSSSKQYYTADLSLRDYITKGIPKEKLCIGLAFYGYNFKTTGLYTPITKTESSSISYTNANALINQGWTYLWDDVCKVPYLQNSAKNRIVVYDDTTSIKLKCDYVRKNGLGGAIIWKLGFDYGSGKVPLLETVGKYLLNYPSAVPVDPSLFSPVNNYIFDTTVIKFMWNPADNATSYNIQVDTTYIFQKPVINKRGISLTNYTFTTLKRGKEYYWRVCASNLNGDGEWTDIRNFKVNAATSVVNLFEESIPDNYKVESYPNPFNPSTKIKISLPEASLITLRIFDVLGQEVRTLLNEERPAGIYEVGFDASGLPAGTYICHLYTGKHSTGIKILLLK